VIGDVQRAGLSNVQHTFTAGQFLLYWKYITPLDGVYYIDVPPQAETQEFEGRLKRLWQLFGYGPGVVGCGMTDIYSPRNAVR